MATRTAKSRKAAIGRPLERPASPTPARVTLHRVSKGKRAQFHDHEAVDQLFAVVTALTAELSVAFDRLHALEQVLVEAGALPAGSVESYAPAAAVSLERARSREELLARVFAVFEAYGTDKLR